MSEPGKFIYIIHHTHVQSRHLGPEHRLNTISWMNILDHREHEIKPFAIVKTGTCLRELANKAPDKIRVLTSQSLGKEVEVKTSGPIRMIL